MQVHSGYKDHFDIVATPIQNVSDLVGDAPSSIDEKTAELNLKRHNLTIKDMANDSGLMKTNSTTESKNQLSENNEKEKKTRAFQRLIHQLEQARIDAESMRDLVNMKIEELDVKIDLAKEEQQTLQDQANTISDAVDHFEETGQFDLNDDGTFKNDTLENAIKEWEAEHGEVNRENYALLHYILEAKLDDYNDQISTLDRNIDQWEQEKRDYEDLDKRLAESEAKLDSDDPDVRGQGAKEIHDLDLIVKQMAGREQTLENASTEEIENINQEISGQVSTINTLKF